MDIYKTRLQAGYTFVILVGMKTAISIPDEVYEEAEITARHLGLARSQLYTQAIKEFIERYDRDRITSKLDRIYSPEESGIDQSLQAGLDTLRESTRDDSW